MKETDQLRKLMESVYTPIVENDDHRVKIQAEFTKIITMANAYFTSEGYEEDEALEEIYDLYLGALENATGGEF